MAVALYLKDIPDDFSASYLTYTPSLRQKQKATGFMKDSYVTSMRFYSVGEENIQVKARVFRSQRKTEEPHQVNLDINVSLHKLDDAHCSCKAGYVWCCKIYDCFF